MIQFLFFCSGATALIYEVIWSRYLTLLFGSTIEAQTVVLAVFMGGLALGNKLFSRPADSIRFPLVIYGRIEISVGVYAILFPLLYHIADAIFAGVGSRFLDQPGWLLALKGILSAALLLGPTILMGGTLPVLAAWLQKSQTDSGQQAARFYSTNSFGAVCGAGLSGFLLVRWLGLEMTMELAAFVNVLIGAVAIFIGRTQVSPPGNSKQTLRSRPRPADDLQRAGDGREAPRNQAAVFHWSCMLVALTGGVSMSLEVVASRCLALIFGASAQVFAIVLMAFILGIGLGSAVIASSRWKHWPREIVTMILLLAATALTGLLVFNLEQLVALYLYAQSGLSHSATGYYYHQICTSLVAICVLGLPAAAMGAVLPLWIRGAAETSDLLGDHVGRLLTWNTLGAVVGVLLTGFVFLPGIGLRGSFAVLGFVLVGAVLLMAVTTRRKLIGAFGVLFAVLLAAATVSGDENWRDIFSAGIFRFPDMDFSQKISPLKALFAERHRSTHLLFYKDAADATVSVEQARTPYATNELILRINGKPDASAYGDRPTQIMLAQLPLMVKPDSQDVFCFGMGSGITAGSTLGYPIAHLTIAENCEPVLEAVKLFEPWNRGVFTNDRVHIYREDARTVLKLSTRKYDSIISEPSNPWTVGIGSVFSRDFYHLAASRLKPGGLMTQWFHLYEMDDHTLDVVLRAFGSAFPFMEIWDVGDEDIILLGSDGPWKSDPDVYQRAFQLDGPRNDLASIGFLSPQTILTRQFASQDTAFAIAGPGEIQSDDIPILEYDAPKAFYMFHGRAGVEDFLKYDERTWQMELAPRGKNQIEAGLSLADLNPIFGLSYGSGNPQLQSVLDHRFQGHPISLTVGARVMPCVFGDANQKPVIYTPPSAWTNMVVRELYSAEVALSRGTAADKTLAMQRIKDNLAKVQIYNPLEADWSPTRYAAIGCRACLRVGQTEQAKTILSEGLRLEPNSDELKYLSRVLSRRE